MLNFLTGRFPSHILHFRSDRILLHHQLYLFANISTGFTLFIVYCFKKTSGWNRAYSSVLDYFEILYFENFEVKSWNPEPKISDLESRESGYCCIVVRK